MPQLTPANAVKLLNADNSGERAATIPAALNSLTRALRTGSTGTEAAWQAKQSIDPWAGTLLPTGTSRVNEWASAGTAGVVSVDTTVLFGRRPTTKIEVTGAGSGTAAEIGFSAAIQPLQGLAAEVLQNYVAVAVRGTTPVASAKIYIGDATFANYYEISIATNDVNAAVDIGDGWRLLLADTTAAGVVTTTGTPTLVGAKRMKVTCFSPTNVAPGTAWLGYVGVVKKPKATIVLTCDDAYAEWYDYLFPAMVERGIPGSFSIDSGYVNKAGYMTERQLRNALASYGDFIEYVNHGANNFAYNGANLAAYTGNIIACDNLLTKLGVPEASRKLHTYVQGQFDQALINWLEAAGFTAARQVGGSDRTQYNLAAHLSLPAVNRNSLYGIPAGCHLGTAQPLETVIGYIENAKARGSVFFIMGHEFKAAAGVQAYVAGYHATHGMSNLLDYLAAERDAGNIDLMKWSEYRASFGIGRQVSGVTTGV